MNHHDSGGVKLLCRFPCEGDSSELVGPGISALDGDIWYLYPQILYKTGFVLSVRNTAAV